MTELVPLEELPLRVAAMSGPRGFPVECFVALPNDEPDFFCSLCKLVMREAVVINGCCGSYFCYQCLRSAVLPNGSKSSQSTVLSCPLDQKPFKLEDIYAVDIVNRNIRALTVKCHIASDRCAAAGPLGCGLEFWRHHEKTCDYAPCICQFCSRLFHRRDHTRHEQFECELRRIRCVQCGQSDIAVNQLEAHLRECPSYEVNRVKAELLSMQKAAAVTQQQFQLTLDSILSQIQQERSERQSEAALLKSALLAEQQARVAAEAAAVQQHSEWMQIIDGLTLEFRIGIAEVRSAVESKVDAMFVEACTQKSQSQFQSQLQHNLQSVQDRMQKMDSDLAESRTRTAALPIQTINTTNASSDIEKQLIGKLESEQMALRADVQSLSAQLKTLSTASGELDQRFSEGIHRLESGLSQLQQSTSHFRTFAEPILNRMETPLSSRILPALDKSLSLDVKPPSTPTSAYQQPLYAGQTFVHPGQWRKHKLLEYWSCCQTPATGNKDAIGCSLREEAQRRHGMVAPLPSPSGLPPTPLNRSASSAAFH